MRRALELAPGSVRALAREAGVSEGLLRAIRDGRRNATPATVEALAGALERIGEERAREAEAAETAARTLKDSLERQEENDGT